MSNKYKSSLNNEITIFRKQYNQKLLKWRFHLSHSATGPSPSLTPPTAMRLPLRTFSENLHLSRCIGAIVAQQSLRGEYLNPKG